MCLSFGRDALSLFFFFNDTATTEIYTLSLHDALPIFRGQGRAELDHGGRGQDGLHRAGLALGERLHRELQCPASRRASQRDRKSTRLNSSHANISYAVFCLKKKKKYSTFATELQTPKS